MDNLNNSIEALQQYIEQVALKSIGKSDSQTIISGIIEESVPGHYNVSLTNGNLTTVVKAYPIGGNQSFVKGDQVFLIKADTKNGKSLQTKYYVCGRVSDLEEDYEKATPAERFIEVGEAYTVPGTSSERTINNAFKQVINAKDCIDNIKRGGSLRISGIITAEANGLSKTQAQANYGFKVLFFDQYGKLLLEEPFDVNYFEGQPFNLNAHEQLRVIEFKPQSLLSSLDSIKIIGFNDISANNLNPTVKNMKIQPGYVEPAYSRLKVEIEPKDGQGYFKTKNQTITLTAKTDYDGQKLFSENLKYFWFVEDKSITDQHSEYFPDAGAGWKCLNAKSHPHVVMDDFSIEKDESRIIWAAAADTITLSIGQVNGKLRPKIKCIVRYYSLYAEDTYQAGIVTSSSSPSNSIVAGEALGFDVELISSSASNTLLQKTDAVTLTCKITKKDGTVCRDSDMDGFRFVWYANGTIVNESEDSQAGYFKIVIDNDNENTAKNKPIIYYDIKDADAMYTDMYCVVTEIKTSLEVESNTIRITSSILEDIETKTYYKYYYHTSSQLTFQQDEKGEWQGYEYNNSSNAWEEISDFQWKSFIENGNELTNEEAYSRLFNIRNYIDELGDWWVYYTTKVSSSDWSKPQLYKQIQVTTEGKKEISNSQQVEQINTFNELTQHGTKQGGFYAENEEYYINANYIQTGALTVANGGEVLFKADLSATTPTVEIAGFTVDGENKSLSAGNDVPDDEKKVGPGAGFDYRYFGKDGLQIGSWLWINKDGLYIDKTAKIFDDVNASGGTTDFQTILDMQPWVVYSESVEQPAPPTAATIGPSQTWHENLTEKDKWMCQKRDVSLSDNVPWGGIIPLEMKDGLTPNKIVDYYCIWSSNTEPPQTISPGGYQADITNWERTFTPPTKSKPYVWNFEAAYYDESETDDQDAQLVYISNPAVIFTYGENVKSYQEYYALVGVDDHGDPLSYPDIWEKEGVSLTTDWNDKFDTLEWPNVRLYDITVFTLESQSGQTNETVLSISGQPTYQDLPLQPYYQYNFNDLNTPPDDDESTWKTSHFKTGDDGTTIYANWSRSKNDYNIAGKKSWGKPFVMRGATGASAPTQYTIEIDDDSEIYWVDEAGNPSSAGFSYSPKVYIKYGTVIEDLTQWIILSKDGSSQPSESGKYLLYDNNNLNLAADPSIDSNSLVFNVSGLSDATQPRGSMTIVAYVDGDIKTSKVFTVTRQTNKADANYNLTVDALSITRIKNSTNNTISYSPETVTATVKHGASIYTGNVYYYWYSLHKDPTTTDNLQYEYKEGESGLNQSSVTVANFEPAGASVVYSMVVLASFQELSNAANYSNAKKESEDKNSYLGEQAISFLQDGEDGEDGQPGTHGSDIALTTITKYYYHTSGAKEPNPPTSTSQLNNWKANISSLGLDKVQGGTLWECVCTQWTETSYTDQGTQCTTSHEKFGDVTKAQLETHLLAWKSPDNFTEIDGGKISANSISVDQIYGLEATIGNLNANVLTITGQVSTIEGKLNNVWYKSDTTVALQKDTGSTYSLIGLDLSYGLQIKGTKGTLTIGDSEIKGKNGLGLYYGDTVRLSVASDKIEMLGAVSISGSLTVGSGLTVKGALSVSSASSITLQESSGGQISIASKTVSLGTKDIPVVLGINGKAGKSGTYVIMVFTPQLEDTFYYYDMEITNGIVTGITEHKT